MVMRRPLLRTLQRNRHSFARYSLFGPKIPSFAEGVLQIVRAQRHSWQSSSDAVDFSKSFLDKLSDIKQNGFQLKEAKVNFKVHWTNDEQKFEVKIVLPELHFERASTINGLN